MTELSPTIRCGRESVHPGFLFSLRPPWHFTAIHGGLHPADIPPIQERNLRGLFLTPCRFHLPPWKTDHRWTGTAGHPCRFRTTEKPSVTLSEAVLRRRRSEWRHSIDSDAMRLTFPAGFIHDPGSETRHHHQTHLRGQVSSVRA